MVDKEIDEVVNKTLELIKKEDSYYNAMRPWDEKIDVIYRLLNRKRYIELLINGEITNNQRKIYDLIEEYQRTDSKKFIIKLIKSEGYFVLLYAGEEHRNDKDIVLEAVRESGYALQFASEELRNDKEVVLESVKQIGDALHYASKELQDDEEIVLEAVKNDGFALNYASERLKQKLGYNENDYLPW